jgi:hypothetical protein
MKQILIFYDINAPLPIISPLSFIGGKKWPVLKIFCRAVD